MNDSDDGDLENLRQIALSSLLKKKSLPLQTNAVFYRPVSNSNLISIQPIDEIDKSDKEEPTRADGIENSDSEQESSSGSEYAVIEEGLSVSSGDVDQVIEEVVVSESENVSTPEEEEAEDAVSIASHDSFDEILNSVEEEMRGSRKRAFPDRNLERSPNAADPKRVRTDPDSLKEIVKPSTFNSGSHGGKSPVSHDKHDRRQTSHRQGTRRPLSPHTTNRERRSKSPAIHRSSLRHPHSPVDNWQSKPAIRKKSPSPVTHRKRDTSTNGNGCDSPSRSHSLRRSNHDITRSNGLSRSNGVNDSERSSASHQKKPSSDSRPFNRERFSDRRRSSPSDCRNKLAFGDHRLRNSERDSKKHSSRNSSLRVRTSRSRSRSTGNRRRKHLKILSQRKVQLKRTRSPSSDEEMELPNVTEEQRLRLQKRRLKFKSEPSQSGKIILKSVQNEVIDSHSKLSIISELKSQPGSRVSREKTRATGSITSLSSRLSQSKSNKHGVQEKDTNSQSQQRRDHHENRSIPLKDGDSHAKEEVYRLSNDNCHKSSTTVVPKSTLKLIGEDDLRNKLQQKRAANIGRMFSAALKDTLHAEPSTSPLT